MTLARLNLLPLNVTDYPESSDHPRPTGKEAPMTTPGNWRKSSRSAGNSGNCVEARLNQTGPEIRDSKLGGTSPVLELTRVDFAALLDSVKLPTTGRTTRRARIGPNSTVATEVIMLQNRPTCQ